MKKILLILLALSLVLSACAKSGTFELRLLDGTEITVECEKVDIIHREGGIELRCDDGIYYATTLRRVE
jgi:hypothetical protein